MITVPSPFEDLGRKDSMKHEYLNRVNDSHSLHKEQRAFGQVAGDFFPLY